VLGFVGFVQVEGGGIWSLVGFLFVLRVFLDGVINGGGRDGVGPSVRGDD
jgi:hypothetical protein